MQVLPRSLLRDLVTLFKATGAPLDGVKVALYKNDFTPSQFTVFADFELADFSGYALSSAITWGTAYSLTNGFAEMSGGVKQFTATASTVTNTIYGYIITNADGDDWVTAERFDTPVPVTQAGDAVFVYPRFQYDGLAGTGQ